MVTYRIKQIGSLKTGWAIERDGVHQVASEPMVLGAYLEVILAGAHEFDASIAKAIGADRIEAFLVERDGPLSFVRASPVAVVGLQP